MSKKDNKLNRICPCGSGMMYRNCCYSKYNNGLKPKNEIQSDNLEPSISSKFSGYNDEGEEVCFIWQIDEEIRSNLYDHFQKEYVIGDWIVYPLDCICASHASPSFHEFEEACSFAIEKFKAVSIKSPLISNFD